MKFVEMVPRDIDALKKDAAEILNLFPEVTGFNIPDVLRLENRSYDAVRSLLEIDIDAIPHIRCIDHPIPKTLDIITSLVDVGLTSVLLISGDIPSSPSAETHPIKTTAVVEAVKSKLPNLNVYSALDPYRNSIQKELQYCQDKTNAGADGFFTQPFFDARLASIYLEQLSKSTVFVGLSPVTSPQSYAYWETKNHVVFPDTFEPNLAHNIQLGKHILGATDEHKQHSYFMPIKTEPIPYLTGIFS
ncbi:MAG: methylenetetrahydrofolate reductase [Candidatus Margulisbacteria bacterium]|nr:methylenetetrahydrofolate reductase [Candidatus Margulisiibacteriota bacterium]